MAVSKFTVLAGVACIATAFVPEGNNANSSYLEFSLQLVMDVWVLRPVFSH